MPYRFLIRKSRARPWADRKTPNATWELEFKLECWRTVNLLGFKRPHLSNDVSFKSRLIGTVDGCRFHDVRQLSDRSESLHRKWKSFMLCPFSSLTLPQQAILSLTPAFQSRILRGQLRQFFDACWWTRIVSQKAITTAASAQICYCAGAIFLWQTAAKPPAFIEKERERERKTAKRSEENGQAEGHAERHVVDTTDWRRRCMCKCCKREVSTQACRSLCSHETQSSELGKSTGNIISSTLDIDFMSLSFPLEASWINCIGLRKFGWHNIEIHVSSSYPLS